MGPFLKHMLCRLSEVFYRIVLLSLFWAVCGGLAFGILLGVELLIVVVLTFIESNANSFGVERITFDECLLRFQALVILPSEMVYAASAGEGNGSHQALTDCGRQSHRTRKKDKTREEKWDIREGFTGFACGICPTLCCFYFPAIMLSTLCRVRNDHFVHPTLRIGVSMSEWTIIIFFHVYDVYNEENFLLHDERGLFLFIIGLVCFLIYSQYLSLLPKFILPLNASIRSKFGYAFNGELEELKRLNLSAFGSKKRYVMSVYYDQLRANKLGESIVKKKLKVSALCDDVVDFLMRELKVSAQASRFYHNKPRIYVPRFDLRITDKQTEISDGELREKVQQKVGDEWVVILSPVDEEIGDKDGDGGLEATMTMFAFANEHYDIVEWLEQEHNARRHQALFGHMRGNQDKLEFVRNFLDPDRTYFSVQM